MTKRHDQQLEAAAAIGRAIGEAIPGRITLHHQVEHQMHYDEMPRPTLVYAEVENTHGERWMVSPVSLGRGMTSVLLPSFPIAWITGRHEDNVLGQANIRLRFEYRP